jgi:hypothetical protein
MLEVVEARCRSRRPSGRHGKMRDDVASSMKAAMSLSAAPALALDRLGFWSVGGGGGGTVNLVFCAAGPHLLFMAQCDGSSPATNGLDRPRSGRVREEAHRALWEINPTLRSLFLVPRYVDCLVQSKAMSSCLRTAPVRVSPLLMASGTKIDAMPWSAFGTTGPATA